MGPIYAFRLFVQHYLHINILLYLYIKHSRLVEKDGTVSIISALIMDINIMFYIYIKHSRPVANDRTILNQISVLAFLSWSSGK